MNPATGVYEWAFHSYEYLSPHETRLTLPQNLYASIQLYRFDDQPSVPSEWTAKAGTMKIYREAGCPSESDFRWIKGSHQYGGSELLYPDGNYTATASILLSPQTALKAFQGNWATGLWKYYKAEEEPLCIDISSMDYIPESFYII